MVHGGVNSVLEAIHHAVPLVGVDFYGDQKSNVQRMVDLGAAVPLSYFNITEKSLLWAANTVLDNERERGVPKHCARQVRVRFGADPVPVRSNLRHAAHGSEVYLSIVRDKYEYDLEPILSQFGQIYDMRLMVDFSGTNRGFAYVRYATPEIARAAVIGLNQSNVRGSVIKKATMSDDNCVLFVTGIPVHLTRDEIYEHFSRRTERLFSVSVCHSANFKSPNRGFCFLEYINHSYAAQARRELLHDLYVQEWRVTLTVNWSIPDKMKNDPSYVPVKNIFVSNLPDDITFQRLMGFLSQQIETSYITHCISQATPLPNLMSARSFVTIPNVNYNSSLSPRSPLTPLAFPPFNYSSWSNQAMSPNLMSATPHSPAFVYPSPHSPNVIYRSGVLPSLPS
ncbi:probable RNA-binding protein 46 [Diaphorina citri]|uniref:Probable RNA-binding protein 46 n=1 Tax=Diaphorina citri TaxID=121845 RepID=A0A1S4EGS1_DIACI|nr:probable RNA-binding protein 46 [Diaphorina citri]